MNKHYIYEIKGVKIGCTKDLEARVAMYNDKGFDYKLEDLIILDILTNETDEYAGDYEIHLQKKLGYPVDASHYAQCIKRQKIRAQKAVEVNKQNGTGLYNFKIRSMGIKYQKKNKLAFWNSALQSELGKRGAAANRKNGTGLYDSNTNKKAIESQRKNKTGFFNSNVQEKVHLTMKEKCSGFYNSEIQSLNAKKAVEINRKNKTGCWAKVKCPYCDYINNPGNVGKHINKCKFKFNSKGELK